MSINRRLKEFLHYLGIGQNAFEKIVGLSNGYINNVKSIGSDKVVLISEQYPELNIEWLILGKGEMLKKETETIPIDEDLLRMTRMLLEKDKENEMLKIKIKELEEKSVFRYQRDDDLLNVAEEKPELKKK